MNWSVEELLEELRKHKEALIVAMINLEACDTIHKVPGARRAAEICKECLK